MKSDFERAKDAILGEIEALEAQIAERKSRLQHLEDLRAYFTSFNGATIEAKPGQTVKWKSNAEAVRAIVHTLKGEFTSDDLKRVVDAKAPNVASKYISTYNKSIKPLVQEGILDLVFDGERKRPNRYRVNQEKAKNSGIP